GTDWTGEHCKNRAAAWPKRTTVRTTQKSIQQAADSFQVKTACFQLLDCRMSKSGLCCRRVSLHMLVGGISVEHAAWLRADYTEALTKIQAHWLARVTHDFRGPLFAARGY